MDIKDVMEMAIKAGAVEQVGKMMGVSDKEASSAIAEILPVLIQGMQGQAKGKDTKDSFIKALNDHGKDDTSDIGKFIKNIDLDDGAKIVNHLLGSKEKEEVAAKAGKKSGLDAGTVIKIMAVVAPILMTQMGKKANNEAKQSSSGDMGGIVGSLLDNVDVGDVIKIAGILLK